MILSLGTVAMTPAQSAAWYAALPWWVKPFAAIDGTIQSGFCALVPNNSACLKESNPLYTQPVATATAPGLPIGYDPATGVVDASNTGGSTSVFDYGSAIVDSLPDESLDSSLDAFAASGSIPGWVWLALAAVVAAVVLMGGKRR